MHNRRVHLKTTVNSFHLGTVCAVAFLETLKVLPRQTNPQSNGSMKRKMRSSIYVPNKAGGQMIRSQGKYFSKDELNRIVMLLRDSDMTLPEIADRMRCSRSAVAAINRKFQIRLYGGKRSQWSLNSEYRPVPLDSSLAVLQEVAATES
jgi:hypothetical protein